jgi:DNA-binding NarL/FixJ family response regulator
MMIAPFRLLIADDTDAVRHAICSLLCHEASITICGEARNFVELFSLLGECSPDVILMDLHMPDERQYDSARIKSRLRGYCLLAMSIWDDEQTVRLEESFGAFKLLNKANLAFVLTPTIKECADEKRRARA